MAVIKRNPFDQLIIDETDDQNAVEDSWRQKQAANPSTDLIVSSNFTRLIGGTSMRVECNKGSEYNGTHRSEVRSTCQLGFERWFSFSVLWPNDYENDPSEELFQQMHAGSGSPPMSFRLNGVTRWAQLKHGTTASSTEEQFPLPDLVKGQWDDFVYHFKIDNTTPSNGFWRVWLNRELVVNWQGAVSYSDVAEPPYLKLGLYKWKWTGDPGESISTQRIFYYDESAWGDGSDEVEMFELMDPEGRKALSGINYPASVPDIPILSNPIDTATGVSVDPSLSWQSASGADSYEVQVATDIGFSNLVVDDTNVLNTSLDVLGLDENTVYYWRVRAENTEGFSSYSEIWGFTTEGAQQGLVFRMKFNIIAE